MKNGIASQLFKSQCYRPKLNCITTQSNIHLKFTPNDLVEADNIGLVQTVKTLRNKKAGGAADIPSSARTSTLPNALEKCQRDLGRGSTAGLCEQDQNSSDQSSVRGHQHKKSLRRL